MGKKKRRILIVLFSFGLIAGAVAPAAQAAALKYKGIAYATWWSGAYATADSDISLFHLSRTGAEWISLIVTAYQDRLGSTTIYRTEATPTDEDLMHAIDRAHRLGLRVMLKPHVDLWEDPEHWRGQIGDEFTTEAEWEAWFQSYREFINHYAELAADQGAEMFCAGTELEGTTRRADDWRAVIAGIRSRYVGPLVYAGNHSGEETSITWWDAVDLIGVDAYYPLAQGADPTLDQLKEAWAFHRDTLAALAAQWNKPLIFTEIGYRSISGTASHPADWQMQGTVDLQEQADAYEAVRQTFDGLAWFEGIFWWSWGTDPKEGGPTDDGFSPYDKPAEAVIRKWYGARSRWLPGPRRTPDHIKSPDPR